MQLGFEFFLRQMAIVERILWTLTFAAQLVLLVVLLGRDRARRYPWFTAGIALSALQLMAEVLLTGRMAKLPLQEILFTLARSGSDCWPAGGGGDGAGRLCRSSALHLPS